MIKVRVVGDITEHDLAEVRDLLEAVGRFDDHQALGDHKWLDLVHGGRPRFTGFIAEDPPHPHPVGYAHLSAEGDSAFSPGPPVGLWGLQNDYRVPWGYFAAASLIVSVPVMGLFLGLQRYFRAGLTVGGVKG